MDFIFNPLFSLLSLALLLVFVMALVSPFEALGWWSGWSQRHLEQEAGDDSLPLEPKTQAEADHYVVYLTGIGGFSGEYLATREITFLQRLEEELPGQSVIVRDVFPYSVTNNPLSGERQLTWLWQWLHKRQLKNPNDVWVFVIVLRNLFQVAISSDPRYGPINNLGVAREIGRSLLQTGYQPGSGKAITLIGYSGGGQISVGVARYLNKAFEAPIRIFSLGGVIGDDPGIDEVEHLYQITGAKDFFPGVGDFFFPGHWPLLSYSPWNKAKRQGRITVIDPGPTVTHVGGADYFSESVKLPTGQSHMDRTLEIIVAKMETLQSPTLSILPETVEAKSNYLRFQQAAFNRPDFYPIEQSVSAELYRPITTWLGRLILPTPEQRRKVQGCLFEVYHADQIHPDLVGQVVNLRWSNEPEVQKRVWAITKDLFFSEQAKESKREGLIHPDRLNRWYLVNPLESLAGSRPYDDVVVALPGPVVVEGGQAPGQEASLYIRREPIQVSGRFYALVKFLGPVQAESEEYHVAHFNRTSRAFDGPEEVVRLPAVLPTIWDIRPSTRQDIEHSPLNPAGWYIYGAQDCTGVFVVQALAPRALFRLQPTQVVLGKRPALRFLKRGVWENAVARKGQIDSVLLDPQATDLEAARTGWQEGDEALLTSVYGGIGGNTPEPHARFGGIYFGHFAYGTARVVREPLADELRFEIVYHQIYTHNIDGLIAGSLHWSRYMGDRQFGFAGFRPVADILLKLDAFTAGYDFPEGKRSALDELVRTLEMMTARYRIGDGTGGTYVAAANNCAQDSNQALYATIKNMDDTLKAYPPVRTMFRRHPDQAERFERLLKLGKSLRGKLLPLGTARADWEYQIENLGSNLEQSPISNLLRGLVSWRTMMPGIASRSVAQVFVKHGASAWVLRTNQVGGNDPDIEPLAPFPH